MKLLLATIIGICLSYEVFASPFPGHGGKGMIHGSGPSDCTERPKDCANAEKDPCKHCGCPDKKGNDVCMLIRCRNDCINAKADPCNHCGCKDEKGDDVCMLILCASKKS